MVRRSRRGRAYTLLGVLGGIAFLSDARGSACRRAAAAFLVFTAYFRILKHCLFDGAGQAACCALALQDTLPGCSPLLKRTGFISSLTLRQWRCVRAGVGLLPASVACVRKSIRWGGVQRPRGRLFEDWASNQMLQKVGTALRCSVRCGAVCKWKRQRYASGGAGTSIHRAKGLICGSYTRRLVVQQKRPQPLRGCESRAPGDTTHTAAGRRWRSSCAMITPGAARARG